MPRKGENIRKRKDGRWEGRYANGTTGDGRRKYTSVYAASYGETKEKLLAVKTRPDAKKRCAKKLFEEVLLEWLHTQALRNKASTQVKFHNLIIRHISPALGGLALEQITTAKLTQFLQEKADCGRLDGRGGLSGSTLRALILILKSSLEYAAAEEYMTPMRFTLRCPEITREAAKALTGEEQMALERELRREMDAAKLGIMICLYTGLRVGEVCALRWCDIDLFDQLVHVRHTVQRLQNPLSTSRQKTAVTCGPPKSECSRRSIPIPPCLLGLLKHYCNSPDAYILTGQPKRLMEPRTYQYRFKKYSVAAGLDKVNFHILRHTFATRFIELGGDPKALSELLGHASVEITLNKYVHPSLENKRQQVERFSAIWGQDSGQADAPEQVCQGL